MKIFDILIEFYTYFEMDMLNRLYIQKKFLIFNYFWLNINSIYFNNFKFSISNLRTT